MGLMRAHKSHLSHRSNPCQESKVGNGLGPIQCPLGAYAGTGLSFRYTRKASAQNGFIFSAGVLQTKV